MASNNGFTTALPSDESSVGLGDDELRSIKSFMQAWWEEEHFATDGSETSAGIHKQGSARAYVGSSSQLSNPEPGKLFINTSDDAIYGAFSTTTWTRVASIVQLDSVNAWTARQVFESGASFTNSGPAVELTNSSGILQLERGARIRWDDDAALDSPSVNVIQTQDNDTMSVGTLQVGGGANITQILSGSFTTNIPSIPAGNFHQFNISVTGASPGDPCFAGFEDTATMLYTATCEAADQVTINMKNDGVGSADPDNQTITVLVYKVG